MKLVDQVGLIAKATVEPYLQQRSFRHQHHGTHRMLQPGQTGKAFGGNGKGVLEATLQLTPTPAAPLGQTLDPQGWLIVEALDQAIFRLRP